METTYYALNPWWEERDYNTGINRPEYLKRLDIFLGRKQIEVLIGSRRVGKTTLLKQFIRSLVDRGVSPGDIFYLALDHPSFSGITISEHLRNFRKIFMRERGEKVFFFLDEVHESTNWELELKSIYDMENIKIFCTGSTSALLTQQGNRLTGRQIITTVYTLSFKEFMLFQGDKPSLSEDYRYEKRVEEYLQTGGYPENVLNPSIEYMSNLLEDILARDLIRLYPIKKGFVLKDLLKLIAASSGSRTSFNKLGKTLSISVDTIKKYIHHLESAFLVWPMPKWTTSHTERVYAQKKIYLWDTGLKTLLTGQTDEGAKAENAVFMELKRKQIDCGYFAESQKEVDFITGDVKKPMPVEVKYISAFDWKDRRFSGFKLFLRRFPQTRKGLLITRNVDTVIKSNHTEIIAVPLWRFLLSSDNYFDNAWGN